jgi:hypothetical protein
MSTLKNVTELVRKYNDLELMKQIVALQTEVFDLQSEVRQLREQLSVREQLRTEPPMNYYYRASDPVPHCPKCYEDGRKLIHLPAAEPWNGGIRRDCRVCHETYWEKAMDLETPKVIARSNWMSRY